MSSITVRTPTPTSPLAGARRSMPMRYVVPAVALVGALGFFAGAVASDDDTSGAAGSDADRCAALLRDVEFMPAGWPATQAMLDAAESCPG